MHEAPKPEVLYLRVLHSRVSSGDIRVPAFQRGYVWEENQVLDLLESVYQGFPVGSLLLWRVDSKMLEVEHAGNVPLPDPSEHYPTSYVLDGLQRLTTLYCVFHENDDPRFQVLFDLRERRFALAFGDPLPAVCVRLFDVFDPKKLLAAQSRLLQMEDGEQLVEASLRLLSAFQDYMLPVVTIQGRDVPEVVEIFERVNRTGTPLGPVDFMRAITWSEDFDLGRELDGMARIASEEGFDIPDTTLMKLLGLGADLPPTADAILGLRKLTAADLVAARDRALAALFSTFRMLQAQGIYGYDYVPYEGQLLVAASLHLRTPSPTPQSGTALVRWFNQVSLTEALRGKPDHYVERFIGAFGRYLDGDAPAPAMAVSIGAEELIERRFTVRKALSAGLAAFFASRPPLDLVSGQTIEPQMFMSEFAAGHYAPVLSKAEMEAHGDQRVVSARVLANIVVVTDESRTPIAREARNVLISAPPAALDSQCISSAAVHALDEGRTMDFLVERAGTLAEALHIFVK